MRRLAMLGLVFVACNSPVTAGEDVTSPLGSAVRYARGLAFNPVFPPAFQAAGGSSSGVVDFTSVHVVLHHSDGTVALDTTIDFPAGQDSLTVDLTVKLLDNAPSTGEPMSLDLGYLNAAGVVVFQGGPVSVTAAPPSASGTPNPPVQVPVTYTGPGASAVSVSISPRAQTVIAGAPFSFSAIAKDASGNTLAAPIIWNSLDPAIATITSAAAGNGVAQNLRGTARIIAQLFSGAADTVLVSVTLPASQIIAQSGNAQSGVVGANLANPLVVKVAASDGVGVAGTTVNFAVASGGGSVSNAAVVSDANGLAQTTFKLGTGTGVQSVTATSGSLTNSPLTFSDTAKAATAAKLVVTTQPVNGLGGAPLTAFAVTAEDNNGNIATAFTGAVTIAIATNPGTGALSGTLTTNAVLGVATFSAAKIDKVGTGYTLTASASSLTSATTNAFNISAGPAATIALSSGDAQTASAGSALPAPVVVKVTDLGGNVVSGTTVAFATASGGSFAPASATTGATGLASTTWTLGAAAGAQSMTASATGLTGSPVTINATATSLVAGPAASLVFTTSPTTAVAGVANAPAIVVQAHDAGGLLATTFVGNVTLTIGANPGGSALGGGLVVAAVGGVATFPNVNLNHTGVGYTLIASSGALTAGTSGMFNITNAAAANFAITSGQAQTGTISTALPTPLTVKVTDAFGNAVGGTNVGFAVTTGGGTVGTPAAMTDILGQATSTWTLGATLGAQTVTATSTGLAGSPALFNATATAAGVRTWTGAVNTSWSNAGNWSPAGVPIATDSVVIPFVTNLPTITITPTIKALTLAPSAVLTFGCATLTINGSLDATGGIVGCGGIVLTSATAATMKGTVSTPIQVQGVYTLNGTLAANSLQIQSGSVDMGGNVATIGAGGVSTAGTATITFTNVGSTMVTTGGASFAGGSETGKLTAGSLTVASNFSEGGGAVDAYNAGLGFATVLDGAVATNFSFTDPATSQFGQLIINDAAGVTALSNFAAGSVVMTSGTLTGTVNATLNGPLVDPLGHFSVSNISFTGNTTPVSAGTPAITVTGTVTFNNNPSILAANLTITGAVSVLGNLQINGHTLNVNGAFSTATNGQLTMNNAADVVNVTGNVTFGSTGAGGTMSAGTMHIGGNFLQNGGSFSLSTSGTNTLDFNGAGTQSIIFTIPDGNYAAGCSSASCFQNLTVNKTGGQLNVLTDVKIQGNFTNTSTFPIVTPVSNGPFIIAGNATYGQNMTVHRTGVGGTFSKGAGTAIDSVSYFGAGQTYNPATLGESYTDILGSVSWPAVGTLTGNMTVSGTGVLTVSSTGATVTGTFTTNGTGSITMNSAGALFSIGGNVGFNGGTGILTNGVLAIGGNFTQTTGATAFAAASPHITRFTGVSPTISFANPTTSNFGTLQLQNTGAVTFLTDAATSFDVWLKTGTVTSVTSGGHTVTVGRALYDTTGGRWQATNTIMSGSATMPRTVTSNVTFTGGGILVDSLTVTGNVLITTNLVGMNGHYMKTTGTFGTSASGVIQMQHVNDSLIVKGNASFNGGNETGQMNAGYFEFDGASFVQGTNATSFVADAPHITWFWGAPGQTIAFANPAAGSSHFGNMYTQNTSIVLSSDIFLNGQLESGGQPSFLIHAAAPQLVTSNGANLRNVTFDNVRWKTAGTSGGGLFPSIDNVTFQNIGATTLPQFDYEYSTTTNLTLAGFTFVTTPTGGGSYIKIVGPDTLTMSGVSPVLNGGFLSLSGLGAVLGWTNSMMWSGTVSTDWSVAANWNGGAVPTASIDVTIPSGTPFAPTTTALSNAHNLTVNSSATLTLSGGNLNVHGDLTVNPGGQIALPTSTAGLLTFGNVTTDTAGTTGVTGCGLGAGINLQSGGPFNISGKFCNLNIFGNYTMNGPIVLPGSTNGGQMQVSTSANLTFNGHRLDAKSYGATGGTLTMQNAADSLVLHGGGTGYANFLNGSETGFMTAGTVVLRTSSMSVTGTGFDQTGTANFVVDSLPATINWASPTAGHGVGNLIVKSGSTLNTGGIGLIIAGNLTVQPNASLVSAVNNQINIYGNATADTGSAGGVTCPVSGYGVNLQGTGKTVTGRFCNINVFGTYTANGPVVVPTGSPNGNFVVQGAGTNFTLNGNRLDAQSLSTNSGGTLTMTNTNDSVFVHGGGTGATSFTGGATTGLITAGAMTLEGVNFQATGQGYDASGTNAVIFDSTNAAASKNSIWTGAVYGHGFKNVIIKQNVNFFFSGNQYILGNLSIANSVTSASVSGQSNTIGMGSLTDNSGQANGAFVAPGGTLRIMGNVNSLPLNINVNTLVFQGGGNSQLSSNLTTHYVVVDSSSGLVLNGHTLNTQGNSFTTQNGGVLAMTQFSDSLKVGTAFFNGGASTLTGGDIEFAALLQGYSGVGAPVATASANSFSPTAGLTAHLSTGGGSSIEFLNPGTGPTLSHFWYLQLSTSSTNTLYSDVFVDSLLEGNFAGSNAKSDGAIVRTITTKGVFNSGSNGLSLNTVAINLVDGAATSNSFNLVTWTGSYGASTLFTQSRATAGPTIGLNNFSGASISTGKWINNIGAASLTIGASNTGLTGTGACSGGGTLNGGSSCP